MKRNLVKILSKLSLLSTLFFAGCNISKSNDDVLSYAQKSIDKMRDGYYSVENINIKYRNLDTRNREVWDDTTYSDLIFTNNQETTNEVLNSFEGLYHSESLHYNEALLLKDGKMYNLYFEDKALESKLKEFRESIITPPLVLLDNNKVLINYNYRVQPRYVPFRGKPPITYYKNCIIERVDEGLFMSYVKTGDGKYFSKSNNDLFDKLKDNSSFNIGFWTRMSGLKKDLLVNNSDAYKKYSSAVDN